MSSAKILTFGNGLSQPTGVTRSATNNPPTQTNSRHIKEYGRRPRSQPANKQTDQPANRINNQTIRKLISQPTKQPAYQPNENPTHPQI